MVVFHAEQGAAGERTFAVNGLAQGVDNPAFEERPHHQTQLPAGVTDKVPRRNAAHVGIGHQEDTVVFESHHLGHHLATGASVIDLADIPHGGPAAGGFDGHSHDVFDLSGVAHRFGFFDLLDRLFKHPVHLPMAG